MLLLSAVPKGTIKKVFSKGKKYSHYTFWGITLYLIILLSHCLQFHITGQPKPHMILHLFVPDAFSVEESLYNLPL